MRHRGAQTPDARKPQTRVKFIPLLLGISLILTGIGILWSIQHYRHQADSSARVLVGEVNTDISRARQRVIGPVTCTAAPPSAPTPAGKARAVLSIPSIGLTVPVLAGTEDAALDSGVGHLSGSKWPDQGGTDVLEAHDVTFFAHLPHLKPGQQITIIAPCRSWTYIVMTARVITTETKIANDAQPTLVLVTCFPSDALFLTNQRYVVTASLRATTSVPAALPTTPVLDPVTAALPEGLKPANLSVDSVGIPLGRLHLNDPLDPSGYRSAGGFPAWVQAARLLVAAERAATENRPSWWSVIAPDVTFRRAAILAGPARWVGVVNVTITASRGTVTGGVLTGTVREATSRNPVTVIFGVSSGMMTIREVNAGLTTAVR